MNTDLVYYYKERAKEYEKIYSKPERQEDLASAAEIFKNLFRGKEVFEIACGTGFWTKIISETAQSILATDINKTVLEIAAAKNYLPAIVEFKTADVFHLSNAKKYKNVFGGFIWSHIDLQDLNKFIGKVNSLAELGAKIVFIDNNYVEGSNLPVTEKDDIGNTYQTRILENGTTHKVLKNFPSEHFINRILKDKTSSINFVNLHYYWILEYKTH